MEENDIKILLDKYKAGTASEEEIALLESWYLNLTEQGPDVLSEEERLNTFSEVWANLEQEQDVKQPKRLWPRIAVAASVLLALSFGAYFLTHKPVQTQQVAQVQTLDITPGTNSATLTLANGQKIVLNNTDSGQIAVQGNAIVNKTANGEIVYDAKSANGSEVLFNTVSTMHKEKYKLILADGTNVWLNAASSIKYPTVFKGNKREVEITGEAYFEVAHNPDKPFLVISKGETIEVLGTHFNVNAYNDEPEMRTTLLEGSIKIRHAGQMAMLKPGQQAVIQPASENIKVSAANTKQAVAWKDGQFLFEHTDLKTLMRQVARWYDLDVVYKGNVLNDEINGRFDRNVNLSKMLHILESTDVHFKVVEENGKKKLIITP